MLAKIPKLKARQNAQAWPGRDAAGWHSSSERVYERYSCRTKRIDCGRDVKSRWVPVRSGFGWADLFLNAVQALAPKHGSLRNLRRDAVLIREPRSLNRVQLRKVPPGLACYPLLQDCGKDHLPQRATRRSGPGYAPRQSVREDRSVKLSCTSFSPHGAYCLN